MSSQKSKLLAGSGTAAVAALFAAIAWAAPATGYLMDLTVHIREQMAGMGAMPERTLNRKVCTRAGSFDPKSFLQAQSKSNCKLENYNKSGDVVTFDEVCTVPAATTSHGVFHLTGGASFTGSMHTELSAGGRTITINTNYTARQVGSCDYTPPKASS